MPKPAATCPPSSPRATVCRDLLLDAAEEVTVRLGIGALTLEAVAAEAKVSKGGLLHYYPSKDSLIEALVVRSTNNWRMDYTAAILAAPDGPGRACRGLMGMCLANEAKWTNTMRRSGVVLIAAMANNAKLVQPLRDVYNELFGLLRDDRLTPGVAEIVALAIDGLWFEWLFGLTDRSPARMMAIRAALAEVVERSTLPAASEIGSVRSGGNAVAGKGTRALAKGGDTKPTKALTARVRRPSSSKGGLSSGKKS